MTQLFINSLASACMNLLIAISFWLVYAPTKTFYVSHAAAITLGAYCCHFLNHHAGIPFVVAACLSVAGIALSFAALETSFSQSLRSRSNSWIGLVASIGLYVVILNIISISFGDEALLLSPGSVNVGHKIGGGYVTNAQIIMMCSGVISYVGIALLLARTRLGRAIRGVSSNPELCLLFGIVQSHITLWAVGIGSGLAAIAGVLSALDSHMTPAMGFRLLMNGVVVTIVGGAGGVSGFVWAALLLAIAQQSTAFFGDSKWVDAVVFLILIGFLIWKPLGFSGGRIRKVEA